MLAAEQAEAEKGLSAEEIEAMKSWKEWSDERGAA